MSNSSNYYDEKNWYVVHTYSGYENKVKMNLEKRIITMDMEDKIFQVIVPTEQEVEVKDGKKKERERRTFPGYVLVEMIMTDDSWYVIRNTPGVSGFVGSYGKGSKPVPLLKHEIDAILAKVDAPDEVYIILDYEVGDTVTILEGTLEGHTGKVIGIDADNDSVSVEISMLGIQVVEFKMSEIQRV
jgi:transcription termination/antitermination factor NusG